MHPKFQIRGILNISKFEGTGQWSLVAVCCHEQHGAALACPQGHGPPYRSSSTPRRVHTTCSCVLAPTCSKGCRASMGPLLPSLLPSPTCPPVLCAGGATGSPLLRAPASRALWGLLRAVAVPPPASLALGGSKEIGLPRGPAPLQP